MTTVARDFAYAAFISYRSSSSSRYAKQIRGALYGLARRHGADEFKVFLDTSSLVPGELTAEIQTALESSRCLVVLLASDTKSSSWVDREIRYWLEHGGARERLFLVRVDPALDLDWDEDTGQWVRPGALPEALRDLFDTEQKYLDLPPRRMGVDEAALAPLYAGIADVNTEDLLLHEAEFQRRRRRVSAGLAAVMTVLLIASVVAGALAVRSRNQAQQAAIAARAEADATQSILATSNSYTEAIRLALRAADAAGTPSIRAAMLSLMSESRRLIAALSYPQLTAGHPAAGIAFDQTGSHLLAWGPASGRGHSHVQVWDLDNRRRLLGGRVDAAGLTDLALIGNRILVGCAASGPIMVEHRDEDLRTRRLGSADGDPGGEVRDCGLTQYDGGVVARYDTVAGDGGETPAAVYADTRGETATLAGVRSVAVPHSGSAAVAVGPGGVFVLSPEGVERVSGRPAVEADTADDSGNFFIRVSEDTWAIVTTEPDGYALRAVPIPGRAVDAAPVVDVGQLTGDVAWVTAGGEVGWTGGDQTVQLANTTGEAAWEHYRTTIDSLTPETFIAVLGNTATAVRPPGALVDEGTGWKAEPGEGWYTKTVRHGLGAAATEGEDPVIARCRGLQGLVVATYWPERGALFIGPEAGATEVGELAGLSTAGEFGDCVAVDSGGALSALPAFGGRVSLRDRLVADTVAVSPTGEHVALLRSDLPIEVLSTARTDELPRPWGVTSTYQGFATAALGERRATMHRSDQLLLLDGSGVDRRVQVPVDGDLVAVRPDGMGGLIRPHDEEEPSVFAGAGGVTEAAPACADGTVRYVPADGFTESSRAAEAQILVRATGEGTLLDCRSGRTVDAPDPDTVLDYQVGRERGVVVSRSASGAVLLTQWTRGDDDGLTTVVGPDVSEDVVVTYDDTGTAALAYAPGRHEVTAYRHDDGGWRRSVSIVTGLDDVASASYVDDGNLVLLVSSKGGFEIDDAATGRRLALDTAVNVQESSTVSAVKTTEFDGLLYVYLHVDGDAVSSTVIDVPIEVAVMREQLCQLYAAPECGA